MTVAVASRKLLFPSISGSTGPFSFNFRILLRNTPVTNTPQIKVTKYSSTGVPTDLTYITDYTFVPSNGGINGGTVTLNVAGAAGESLLISGNTPKDQPTKYSNQGRFYPEVHEQSYDQAILINQEQQQDLDRSLKFPLADVSPVTEFPLAAQRANKAAVFDADGDITVSEDDYNDQLADVTAQAAIATAAASTATTQAGISTTQAGISTTQAGIATTQATTSTTQAGISTAQATIATNAATSFNPTWTFDSTTAMADPGTGEIRLNNATLSSVTQAAISETSAAGAALAAWIATFDDSTAANRGYLKLHKNSTNFAIYSISGANTDNGTWDTLTLTYIAGLGSFTNGDTLYISFAQSGNNGAGTGDASTNTSSSVDSEIALFSSTTGKLLKRATGTGYVKVTSGVMGTPAATVPLTDLATQAANTALVNATAGVAAPTALAMGASTVLGRDSTGNISALTLSGLTAVGGVLTAATGKQIYVTEATPYTTATTFSTTIPADDTIPQNTEGTQILSLTHVPANASSKLTLQWYLYAASSVSGDYAIAALFKDSTANALTACETIFYSNGHPWFLSGSYTETAGSTSSRDYKLRFGAASGSLYTNGLGSPSRHFGGVGACRMTLIEATP